jgi:CheY-like chemotaxis protein
MDVQMPVLNGLEAAARIRSEGNMVPIIALTAYATREDAERCIAAGMNGHLSKPLRREHLLVTVRQAVEMYTVDANID